MKQRFGGRVGDGVYELTAPDGGILRAIPLDQARSDTKLKAAIQRNGWQAIPED
jgi:hypothetical protein